MSCFSVSFDDALVMKSMLDFISSSSILSCFCRLVILFDFDEGGSSTVIVSCSAVLSSREIEADDGPGDVLLDLSSSICVSSASSSPQTFQK